MKPKKNLTKEQREEKTKQLKVLTSRRINKAGRSLNFNDFSNTITSLRKALDAAIHLHELSK